jgi:hypothetical protein
MAPVDPQVVEQADVIAGVRVPAGAVIGARDWPLALR